MKKNIDQLLLNGKKVLMRVDFNVPLQDGVITSNKRIVAALPSIKKVIKDGGKLILLSHLGRIKSEVDKTKNNLLPVSNELAKLLQRNVLFIDSTRGVEVETAIKNMKNGDVIILQNTRYEDLNNKAESKNNSELGKYWASLADVFINDAFGTAHRAHASNVGIAQNIKESALGYLMEKEVTALTKAIKDPEHPYVAIIGGAKVSDKIEVLNNLINVVDKMIIGGGMAYTFLKAKGREIGTSLLDEEKLEFAKEFMHKYSEKIVLPVDFKTTKEFADVKPTIKKRIAKDEMSLDIGPETVKLFNKTLKGAKTVVWNGPVGVVEFENFKQGTYEIAKAVANLKNCYSIIGGGDSVAAIEKLELADKFSHVSTGGGASLEFLQGEVLPGIEAIEDK